MQLFLEQGFDQTSVEVLADASGVSRATFFRYFPSKSAVVFHDFDVTITRLHRALTEDPSDDVIEVVRRAVIHTTRIAAENPTWIDRFILMDGDPALRRGITEHWASWMAELSQYVAERRHLDPRGVEAVAVAGAFQAAYVAVLRRWRREQASQVEELMAEMHLAFEPLMGPLTMLVSGPQ